MKYMTRNNNMNYLCDECGKYLLSLPINQYKKQLTISTWYQRTCDFCLQIKEVTQVRDFGYPVGKIDADWIKQEISRQCWNKKEFAIRCDLSYNYILRYLQGKAKLTEQAKKKFARVFGTEIKNIK